MAKKKENKLSYLQMPLPESRKAYRMVKRSWNGLNYRQTIDTGALSMEKNISTLEAPYLTPSQMREKLPFQYEYAISMFGFDDFLAVIYYEEKHENNTRHKQIKLDYIVFDEHDAIDAIHTGIIQSDAEKAQETKDVPRSIVQFNVYDTPTDPVSGQYVKKLLIFPDKASMFMKIIKADSNPEYWEDEYIAAEQDKKTDTALGRADLNVMYYWEKNDTKYYYTVVLVQKTQDDDGYDANKAAYKRVVVKKHEYEAVNDEGTTITHAADNAFFCDGTDVLVKEFTPTEEMATPPDTASHNYYYRNNQTSDIYRWVDDQGDSENSGWKVSIPPAMPDIKYATVHLSRVFGVDDDRVYASGYNDYTNWNLDTVDEYNEANSWCSPAQSNTKAGGKFTGITTFQNHVICFKRDFMHEIYNTKNPFRIQDIYAEGTIDNRTIQDVDGRLIFVSDDNVKVYTGSNPRIISYYLNIPQYKNAVSGTDGRNYYLYCEDARRNKRLFVYDTIAEQWSEQSISETVLSFAHNKNGMYMLAYNDSESIVYKLDSGAYTHNWSFETDLITNETVDIKHVKKMQMFADISPGADIKVYVLYDDEEFRENSSHLVYSSKGVSGQQAIRVKLRQTASYGIKIHVEGYGYIRLYEMELLMENGGDLYV